MRMTRSERWPQLWGCNGLFAEFVAGQAAAINARSVRLRVGVSTGEVIAGRIGNDSFHSENTAMGEAVAVAARMETAAEPGTVLVAGGTYAEVRDKFTWKALGEIRVKGIKEAIAVYRPLAQVHDVAEFPKKQLLNQRYSVVGREKDITTLQEVVTSLVDGRGLVCTITGDKGDGEDVDCGPCAGECDAGFGAGARKCWRSLRGAI